MSGFSELHRKLRLQPETRVWVHPEQIRMPELTGARTTERTPAECALLFVDKRAELQEIAATVSRSWRPSARCGSSTPRAVPPSSTGIRCG